MLSEEGVDEQVEDGDEDLRHEMNGDLLISYQFKGDVANGPCRARNVR